MTRESVDTPEARLLGQALRILRSRAHLSQAEAGARFGDDGVSGEGWRKYEAGKAPSIFSPGTQRKLAEAVGSTVEDLLAERARLAGDPVVPTLVATPSDRANWAMTRAPQMELLPIRDRIQAGAWLLADDYRQDTPATYPVARDPRYPYAQQWLSEVVGDSVNLLNIVEGDLVHCVDAIAIGYYPRTGDIVEVERLRFDGSERELTIKQVEVGVEGVVLWARSTNPRFRGPVILTDGMKDHEAAEVRIRALVLASTRRF